MRSTRSVDKNVVRFYQDMGISVFIILVLLALFGVLNYSMTDRTAEPYQDALLAVESQGYTDITSIGLDHFNCESGYGYAFEATNPSGRRVNLTACKTQSLLHPLGGWFVVLR
jgi:hypothetical protein